MGHDQADPIFIWDRRDVLIVKQRCLTVEHETPVLHGASAEIWDSRMVCQEGKIDIKIFHLHYWGVA